MTDTEAQIEARLSAARELLPELRSQSERTETQGQVPDSIISLLRDHSLLNLVSPNCYGGEALPFSSVLAITGELAKGCMSTAWVATVGNVHNWVAANFHTQAQDEYFADPAVFSAASFAPTGTARVAEGGFIATGRWGFLSGVDHADWVFVAALVAEGTDEVPAGPWFLMLPISEVSVEQDSWDVTGLSGTGSKDIVVADAFVPAYRAVHLGMLRTNQGPGLRDHDAPVYSTPFHPALIAVLCVPILGAARRALDIFTDYTANRVVKMTGGRQAEQAPTQITLAEVAATVHSAGLMLENAFHELDRRRAWQPADEMAIVRDTAFACNQLVDAVTIMMRNAGGGALQHSHELQRIWRDVTAAGNHAALNWASQAQLWGASALKEHPGSG